MTTLTPDLLAHVAAVRDGACDDNELLVLAEKLDDVGMEQPTEYDPCPKCGGAGEVRGWLVDPPCLDCGGNGTVPRPNPLRDRAELIRVQVERGQLLYTVIRKCTGEEASTIPDPVVMRHAELGRREHDLLARNPAWLSAPCPECGGEGLGCGLCSGTGDLLRSWPQPYDRATVTRGFLDVVLPHTLCWQECSGRCSGFRYAGRYPEDENLRKSSLRNCPDCNATGTEPHPVLRAVLASPVGPWVRRVRVEGVEPTLDEGGWEWYGLPDPLCTPETKDTFATAEAATDALSLAVVRWARGAK